MNRDEFIETSELHVQEKILLSLFDRKAPITIFDVGACEAESSIRYSRLFRNAQLYLFEPLPANVQIIRENLARYGCSTAKLYEVAMTTYSGVAPLFVSSGAPHESNFGLQKSHDWNYGNKSSSLLAPADTEKIFPWLKFNKVIEVPTRTIDQVYAENSLTSIDFLHIDAQGAELEVLKGAANTLDNVRSIWLEVETVELYKGQALKTEVELFLLSHKFEKVIDTCGSLIGDQFWVKRDFGKCRLSSLARAYWNLCGWCQRLKEHFFWRLNRILR